MNKPIILALFFLFKCAVIFGQVKLSGKPGLNEEDRRLSDSLGGSTESTSNKNLKNLNAKIQDYKIISIYNDSTYVDTTLTINKEFKYNYLRRDDFNLMPFANLGQTYNTLRYDFSRDDILPMFGARARHFNYMEAKDIYYYRVPTPLTELFYKTGFEQGQLIDAFFTVNTSDRFNFSVAYKALRSLGKYQHALTSTGNLRFTTNYNLENKSLRIVQFFKLILRMQKAF